MITVSRAVLRDELVLLASIVSKDVIGPLETVMLGCDGEHLMLTATNRDATVISEIPVQGDVWGGCVPAHQLKALVKLFDGDEITLTPKKQLEIRCGTSKHLLPLTPIEQFPEIDRLDSLDEFELPAELLREMIKAVTFAMMPDAINPADFKFTGLSLRAMEGTLEVMASKKTVTAIAEAESPAALPPVILPAVAVDALERLLDGDTVTIQRSDNSVEFTCGPRTLIARQLMGQFPAWRTFLPEFKYEVAVNHAEFKAGLQRAMVTMGVDNAAGYEPLRLTFSKEQVVVESRGGDRGKSLEPVAITSNLNGEPLAIGVIGSQILKVLYGETVNLALFSPEQPLLFRYIDEKFKLSCIVVPVNANRMWN